MAFGALIVARAGTGGQRSGGIIALLLAVTLCVLTATENIETKERFERARARMTSNCLAASLKFYHEEYGSPRSGSQSEIVKALRGDNPRKIVFFEARAADFNPKGEVTDPWGTPYRFDLSDPEKPRVYSFGKNKRDDGGAVGSDDICSWR